MAKRAIVREHHAPVGALRPVGLGVDVVVVGCQGAPRTCRCIETGGAHAAPGWCGVREHHAPVGALRLVLAGVKLLGILRSGSTTHLECCSGVVLKAWGVKASVAVCSGGSSSSGGLLRGRPSASPGVMRGVVEGVGVRGPAVTVCSSRPRARRRSRARRDRRVGCRGWLGRRRERFRRPRPRRLSRMVGRRLACRDAPRLASTSLNPRARLLEVRARGLSDVLGGYPTISRTAAPGAAAPRTPGCALRTRERRSDRRGPAERKWSAQESTAMSPLNNLPVGALRLDDDAVVTVDLQSGSTTHL